VSLDNLSLRTIAHSFFWWVDEQMREAFWLRSREANAVRESTAFARYMMFSNRETTPGDVCGMIVELPRRQQATLTSTEFALKPAKAVLTRLTFTHIFGRPEQGASHRS
jgi:hypothetical protein